MILEFIIMNHCTFTCPLNLLNHYFQRIEMRYEA